MFARKHGSALVTSLLALTLLASFSASAGDFKCAVVDMERLFKEYYKTKISTAKLEKQAAMYKDYADKLAESQLKLQEEFKALRDASLNLAYSETERESKRLAAQDKYRQLKAKELELQQYNREKHDQLRKQEEKMRKDLVDEIRRAIARYAYQKGYSLVLDYSGRTLNNLPAVIYFTPDSDITDTILELINKGAKTK
jgi:Skp family chaperone for outer membrane proteins